LHFYKQHHHGDHQQKHVELAYVQLADHRAPLLFMLFAGKFFWFLLFNYLTLIYFTFFGKSTRLLCFCSTRVL